MKVLKKSLSVIIALIMALSCFSVLSFAVNAEDMISVNLRIEGINKCHFNGAVEVANGSSAYDVLKASGVKHTATTSSYGVYVSEIAGDKEATFGGWDGWLYRVDDIEPSVGISDYKVSDGQDIVVFYGDPYGVGIQYPILDLSALKSDGKIRIYSMDTVYDENWNAVVVENPVANCDFYFDGNKFVSDEKGIVTIPNNMLLPGEHSISLEKYFPNGCPAVLRISPDSVVTIDGDDNGNTSIFETIINYLRNIVLRILQFIKNIINI